MAEFDRFCSVTETCERFGIGPSTFYRMLADRDSGLADVVLRIPPVTGRLRIPQRGFEKWLASWKGRRRPRRKGTRSTRPPRGRDHDPLKDDGDLF